MRIWILLASCALALTVVSCSNGGDDASEAGSNGVPLTENVTITHSSYQPPRVKILVGGSITWTSRDPKGLHAAESLNSALPGAVGDQIQHEEDYSFDTFTLTWGEPNTIAFHQPGTFRYYCPYDAGMEGEVEVVARRPPQDG